VAPVLRRRAALGAAVGALLLLTGCSSLQRSDVEHVATAFEDQSGDPASRCDLLLPTTRAALEDQEQASCAEALGDLPLAGGTVREVQIWGGQAQVELDGDTVFLSETSSGWRVAAAACTPRADLPYDCEVEGP
jgi:hypothetical protein